MECNILCSMDSHSRRSNLISAGVKKMKFTKFSIFMVSGKIIKTIIVVMGLGTIFKKIQVTKFRR